MPLVWAHVLPYGSGGIHFLRLDPCLDTIPMPLNIYLVVKDKYAAAAKRAFAGTSISITTNGQRHIGAAIGPREYTEHYVTSKVQVWCDEIKRLSEVTETFPHAAYAAFTHGLSSHWLYIMRTIPDIQGLLQPLEEAIHHFLFQFFWSPTLLLYGKGVICTPSATWWFGPCESL